MRNPYGQLLPPTKEASDEMVRLASVMGVSFARRDVQAELDKEAFPSMAGMGQALAKGFGTVKGTFGVLGTTGAVNTLGTRAANAVGTGIKNTANNFGNSLVGGVKSIGGGIQHAATGARNAVTTGLTNLGGRLDKLESGIKTRGLASQYASNRAQGNVMSAAGLAGPGISQEQRRAAAQMRLQGMQNKGIQMGSKSESIGKLNPATGGTIQAPGGPRPNPAPPSGADPYRTAAPKPAPSGPPPVPAGKVTPPTAGQAAPPPPASAGQATSATAAPAPAGQVTPPPAAPPTVTAVNQPAGQVAPAPNTPPTVTPTPSAQPTKPGLLEQSGLTSNAGTKLMGLGLGLGTLYAGTQVAKHVAGALGGHPHEYQYGNPNGQPQATPNQYGQVS